MKATVCKRCCLIQTVAKIAIGYWYKKNVPKYHSIRKMKRGLFPVYGYWEHKDISSVPLYKNTKTYSLYIYPVDPKFRSWTDVQMATWCREYFYTFQAINQDGLGCDDFRSFLHAHKRKNKSLFSGHIL